MDKRSDNPDIAEAQELYEADKTAWFDVYDAAKDDLQFYVGGKDQWDAEDLKIRTAAKRPSLTTNLLPQFVHQVVNDIRQNVPQMKVLPINDKSDPETAKTIQGWLKNVEYRSSAPVIYDTAAENSVKCSLGWIRIDHEVEDPDNFDEVKSKLQNIRLKRVTNPLSIYIDHTSIECDGSDAGHGTALDQYTKAQFEAKWPGKEAVSFDGQVGKQDEDLILVAEFFKIVMEDVQICQLQDGTILTVEKAQELGQQPVQVKTVKKKRVKRRLLSGSDILEETYFPGEYIPLIPVYGEEHWVDGKRHLISLVRNGKDPQRMVNSWSSYETELLQKAPQSPFIMAEGQAEGHEDDWRNPGSKMVLQYKQTDANGQPAPQPTRVAPPPVPTGVVNARQGAIQDMRDAMGIQQAGLGQKSNEHSGVAIQARVKEGDLSNSHFADNLNRSIEHCGRVCISMMPEVLDTARLIRIIGPEDEPQSVGINGAMAPDQERIFDLTVGKYDVAVVAGPSFTTRRQETQQLMNQALQTSPDLMQVIGDLVFKYSDVPGADVISERLKKTIPPQLLSDDKDQPQIPPQVQQQMQHMEQQGQQLQQALQQCQQELQQAQGQLKDKSADADLKKYEIDAKSRSEETKNQTDQMTLEIKAQELQLRSREIDLQEKQLDLDAQALVAAPVATVPMNLSQPPT